MSSDLAQLRDALAGAFDIQRELGGGGMSRVFVATETSLGRAVVIKVVAPNLLEGISADRFTREVKLAARLQQANIVPLLSAGDADGVPYYTMPFVDGLSLRARIVSGGQMPLAEATHVLRDVAKALAYAHAQGVVHRDIKPENVLLSGGTAMVTDFGIAKALTESRTQDGSEPLVTMAGTLTSAGSSLGTPAYMAPEQAVGSTVDLRADLYAWGMMAYELLTGAHTFAGRTTAQQLITAHLTETPAPISAKNPAIPSALANVVMRCLEKDPERRPASAGELLAALDSASTPNAPPSTATLVPPSVTPRVRDTRRIIAIVAAVIVVGVVILTLVRRDAKVTSGASVPADRSLAVIPFESVGGDTANTYFAEGIADELTIALARLPGLRLAGRSSVARFKGKGANPKEIASALNVAAILDGTVRRSGGRVRVTAQLTNAADGLVLWSDSYDREAQDVFALQDDITGKITSALRMKLAPTAGGPTARVGTVNAEAYDLYLRGLYLYRRRNAGLTQAAELLESAIAKDPNFARAHATLASVLLTEPYYLPVFVSDVVRRARVAAERAVAIDPQLAEAHMALSIAHFHANEFGAAEAEARRSVVLDPASAEAEYRLGFVLLSTGRASEAIAEFERGKAIDPLYSLVAAYLGYAYSLAGRVEEGIAEGQRALEIDSLIVANQALLAYSYGVAGRSADAIALARRMAAGSDEPRRLGIAARTMEKFGAPGEAKPLIAKIEALPPNTPRRDVGLAYAYLGVRDTARALSAMERAANRGGDLLFAIVPTDATFDPVRASPRFAAVLERLHFDVAAMSRRRSP